MNPTQIKYFLEAARCLNFTEAAKQLYITQPALSQQITAIETELNMQLFIRQRNKLRLTPAALVLQEELPAYEKQYQQILEKARIANSGNKGMVKIGILQGQVMTKNFQNIIWEFRKQFPGVYLKFSADSFGGLRRKLDTKELDVIYTTDFDVKGDSTYLYEKIDVNIGAAVVSKLHPLANKKVTRLKELADETIIIIGEEESEVVRKMIMDDCKEAGFVPNLALAGTLNEQMLWIEIGLGVGIINQSSYICQNSNVKILEQLKVGTNYFVVAWHRDNINAASALFTNYAARYVKENEIAK